MINDVYHNNHNLLVLFLVCLRLALPAMTIQEPARKAAPGVPGTVQAMVSGSSGSGCAEKAMHLGFIAAMQPRSAH